jgi:hypothetical protein
MPSGYTIGSYRFLVFFSLWLINWLINPGDGFKVVYVSTLQALLVRAVIVFL